MITNSSFNRRSAFYFLNWAIFAFCDANMLRVKFLVVQISFLGLNVIYITLLALLNEIIIDQVRKPAYLTHSGAGISAWNRKSCVSSFQICPITTYVNSALSWMKIYYFRWFLQEFYSISRLCSILHFTWLQILLLIGDRHFIF